jgi:plastocyanin
VAHIGAALVAVAHAPGDDGSGLVTAYGPTYLSGGSDGGITSLASEVKAAIEASPEAAALVNVVLQDDELMFEMAQTNLDGGDDTTAMEGTVDIS